MSKRTIGTSSVPTTALCILASPPGRDGTERCCVVPTPFEPKQHQHTPVLTWFRRECLHNCRTFPMVCPFETVVASHPIELDHCRSQRKRQGLLVVGENHPTPIDVQSLPQQCADRSGYPKVWLTNCECFVYFPCWILLEFVLLSEDRSGNVPL